MLELDPPSGPGLTATARWRFVMDMPFHRLIHWAETEIMRCSGTLASGPNLNSGRNDSVDTWFTGMCQPWQNVVWGLSLTEAGSIADSAEA
jgi:hypothetical protein